MCLSPFATKLLIPANPHESLSADADSPWDPLLEVKGWIVAGAPKDADCPLILRL